jgi:hypothetical protein
MGVIPWSESFKPISRLIREDPRKSASMIDPATLRTLRLCVEIPESITITSTITIDDYDRADEIWFPFLLRCSIFPCAVLPIRRFAVSPFQHIGAESS